MPRFLLLGLVSHFAFQFSVLSFVFSDLPLWDPACLDILYKLPYSLVNSSDIIKFMSISGLPTDILGKDRSGHWHSVT